MFKIGDKVKIRESSDYSEQHEGIGIVDIVYNENESDLPYRVIWSDNYHNTYGDEDLELVILTQHQKLLRK